VHLVGFTIETDFKNLQNTRHTYRLLERGKNVSFGVLPLYFYWTLVLFLWGQKRQKRRTEAGVIKFLITSKIDVLANIFYSISRAKTSIYLFY
jgi:hypothetical protein